MHSFPLHELGVTVSKQEPEEGQPMIRKAFRTTINPGAAAEYERRHRPIWPELENALKAHGVRSYSIFLDPDTDELFGYCEIESEARWAAIAETDVCRRWWTHMSDLMPTDPDRRPLWRDLREVFRL